MRPTYKKISYKNRLQLSVLESIVKYTVERLPLLEQLTTWPRQRVWLHVKYHVSFDPLHRTVAVLPSSVTVLPAGATNLRQPCTAYRHELI